MLVEKGLSTFSNIVEFRYKVADGNVLLVVTDQLHLLEEVQYFVNFLKTCNSVRLSNLTEIL